MKTLFNSLLMILFLHSSKLTHFFYDFQLYLMGESGLESLFQTRLSFKSLLDRKQCHYIGKIICTRNNCTTIEKCKIFDFVLLAHFRMSATDGFPNAAVKALGLCVQAFLTAKTQAKSLQTAGGQSISIILLCFQLQSPEHPKNSSSV